MNASDFNSNRLLMIPLLKSVFFILMGLILTINCKPRELDLTEYIAEHKSDTIFKLNHKRLKGDLKELGNLKDLEELELNYDGITKFPDIFHSMKNLKKLSLYGNSIQELPPSISQLMEVNTILLGKNPFNSIPESLKNLPNLQILTIDESNIRLTEKDVEILSSLHKLEVLDLSENPGFIKTPSNIAKLGHIKSILLKKNSLDENERKKLYDALPKVSLSK
jgi:Leucine-rich repeat (LRR) protein